MTDIQHVNCKIFADPSSRISLPDAIPIFHRWIQEQTRPELLIDVADYHHVPAGPGVMLIGHEANYSLDERAHRLGLLYNRRTALDGSTVGKLRQAYTSAVDACRALEAEPEFAGKLKFDLRHFELIFNDRLLTPNTPQTRASLQPDLDSFLMEIFGAGNYSVAFTEDPRERLTVAITPAAVTV